MSKDGSYITLTEYNPKGEDDIAHMCDTKGIGMHATDKSVSYEIHCNNPRKVCDTLMTMDMQLRRDKGYAVVHRRSGLGLTEELVQFCIMNHAPTNYGQNAEAFDYVISGFPSHWGYGANGEVRFSEIEYPNGESWDTYQNEIGFTKEDPSVEERIRWCNRINVSIQLSLDAKTTPTSILAKALRFTDDERVKEIVRGIFTEDEGERKTDMEPCPFCGGEVELRTKSDRSAETYFVHCTKCHMWFEKFDWRACDPKTIIKEWNGRVGNEEKNSKRVDL